MADNFDPLVPYTPDLAAPDSVQGLRFWVSNELTKILQSFAAVNADYREFLVHAGYGSASLSAATPIPNITAAFQTLPLDVSLADSRDVDYNLANNAVIIETPGVWRVSINFVMEFTDTNAGRTFDMRIWNLTDSTAIATVPVFVGRNQGGVNFSFQGNFDLGLIEIGDEIVVQVGNASTNFTTVTLEALRIDPNRVSEFKED